MISRDEIVSHTEQYGFNVTPRMFRYWTKKKLLPQPEIRNLGDNQGKKAFYPDETKELVVAICHELEETRDLNDVRWRLWGKGFQVEIRDLLLSELEEYKQFVNNCQDDDFFYELINQQSTEILSKGTLTRQASKKLHVRYHSTFVYLLALCFREPETEYDTDKDTRKDRVRDIRIFEKAIDDPGIESFDIYSFWSKARPYIEPEIFEEILSNSDNETLRQAYQETIKILAVFLDSIFLKQQYDGKKPTNRTLKSIKETIPIALLVWLSLRRNPKIYNWFNS